MRMSAAATVRFRLYSRISDQERGACLRIGSPLGTKGSSNFVVVAKSRKSHKAEAYERAENYVKSATGNKAKERIINGEDPATVLAEMETEWAEYCARRVMD